MLFFFSLILKFCDLYDSNSEKKVTKKWSEKIIILNAWSAKMIVCRESQTAFYNWEWAWDSDQAVAESQDRC